jgi:curved DNA-binding protein CbpA
MNQNNNLYQILGVNKNASQQQIIKVSQDLIPKSSREPISISQKIDEAIMVLTDPQKKMEYDESGWKDEWKSEAEKIRVFRHQIFGQIQNYKHHYGNTYALKPDGFRVYVWPEKHLDPGLWTPVEGWVSKIWAIRGPNWKSELENFKNKMLTALDEAWEKEKKTPLLGDCWEVVENGNCANCEKPAKLRWKKDKYADGKIYCSQECHWENIWKVPRYELEKIKHELPETPRLAKFICSKCHYEGYDCYQAEDGNYYCKSHFNEHLEEIKKSYSPDKKIPDERELYKCVSCGKKTEGNYVSKDQDGNKFYYCSKTCQEKGTPRDNNASELINELEKFFTKKKGGKEVEIKLNSLSELLKWMKGEKIVSVFLNSSDNLVIEYSDGHSQIVNDNNLASERKEIKEFFQYFKEQGGEAYLNSQELEKFVSQKNNEKAKKSDGW